MLYLSSNALDIEEKLQQFSNSIYNGNVTLVAESDTLQRTVGDLSFDNQYAGNDKPIIHPIYDIRDVSIKSCVLKDTPNSNLYRTDEFVDIYAPSMSAYPVEFCQCQEDAYVMTDFVRDNPAMLYSSLNKDRLNYDKQYNSYSM